MQIDSNTRRRNSAKNKYQQKESNRKKEKQRSKESTLQAVAVLSLFANDVENGVDQLSSFGIMTFGPIVSGTGLAKDEVIRAEDLTVGTRSDAVHGARLKIHEHSPGNVPSARSLIVVNIDPLELDVGGGCAAVLSGGIDAVLVADDLPELGADLVAALASLHVQDLSHGWLRLVLWEGEI